MPVSVTGESMAWGCGFLALLIFLLVFGWDAMQVQDCAHACDPLPGLLLKEKNDACYCEGQEGLLFPVESAR
jgi:hypothetical protein